MSNKEVPKQFVNTGDLTPAGRIWLQELADTPGGGAVDSVSTTDPALTIAPTTGAVVASANDFVGDSGSGGVHGLVPAPASGDAGNVLYGDGTWGPAGGSSPLTTKGDIYGFDTADARIPVGSDNQVLTADSAQTLGVKWATPTGGALTLISKQIVTGSPAASIQFASIPQTFSDLIISLWCRSTSTTVTDSQVYLRVNNDNQSSHYTSARYVAGISGTTASTGNILATSNGGSIAYCPGTSSNGAAIGDGQIYIPAYTNGAFAHTIHSTSFEFWAAQYVALRGFAYLITGPITQIDLFPENGSFEVGSQFCLYGRG